MSNKASLILGSPVKRMILPIPQYCILLRQGGGGGGGGGQGVGQGEREKENMFTALI